MTRSARELMTQGQTHLAAWAMALAHAWEPSRDAWMPGEVPWVEDMVEAAFVLLRTRVSVHEAATVEETLRASELGRIYLSSWYLMTVSQYGAAVEEE